MTPGSSSTSTLCPELHKNNIYKIMKPDGKLATVCTMVMLLTTVISCMLRNDTDFIQEMVERIMEHISKFFIRAKTEAFQNRNQHRE